MFIARTKGCDLVTVRALEEIAPQPGGKLAGR
jgi:urea transport system substrate-binding protein